MKIVEELKRSGKCRRSLTMTGFKVHADAVFFSAKLVVYISFPTNCEGVQYGFFGVLEIFSKTAFSILLANLDTCKKKTGQLEDWYPLGQICSHGRGPVCRNVPEEAWSGRTLCL